MPIHDIRRENLRALLKQHGPGSRRDLAIALGHANATHVSHLAGPNPTRQINEDAARKIEAFYGLAEGALDRPEQQPGTRVQEPAPVYTSGAVINDQLLTDCMEALFKADGNRKLDNAQRAELIAMVYRISAPLSRVDQSIVDRLVDIATR